MYGNLEEMYANLVPQVHEKLKGEGLAKLLCYLGDYKAGFVEEMMHVLTQQETVNSISFMNAYIGKCKVCGDSFYGGIVKTQDMKGPFAGVGLYNLHEFSRHPDSFTDTIRNSDKKLVWERAHYRLKEKQWEGEELRVMEALWDNKTKNYQLWGLQRSAERNEVRIGELRGEIEYSQRVLVEFGPVLTSMMRKSNLSLGVGTEIKMEDDPLTDIWNFLCSVGDFNQLEPQFRRDPSIIPELRRINEIVEAHYATAEPIFHMPLGEDIYEDPFEKYPLDRRLQRAAGQLKVFDMCNVK